MDNLSVRFLIAIWFYSLVRVALLLLTELRSVSLRLREIGATVQQITALIVGFHVERCLVVFVMNGLSLGGFAFALQLYQLRPR